MPRAQDPTTYRGPDIPPDLGMGLAAALNLETPPETLGDWARDMGQLAEREDIEVSPDALCTTTKSPHKAEFMGQTQHYRCVQDAFIVPYLVDDVDSVAITTESPVSGTRIDITATDEGIEVDPAGAVMSVGVATDIESPGRTEIAPVAYDKICPYGHAFTDRTEYEEWAESVDAVTMVAPLEDALHFARTIGHAVQ